MRGLGTSTKYRSFSKLFKYLEISGHRSVVPSVGTYQVAIKLSDCRNKLVPILLKVFWRLFHKSKVLCFPKVPKKKHAKRSQKALYWNEWKLHTGCNWLANILKLTYSVINRGFLIISNAALKTNYQV